jgi:DNA-binding beta-propeller fold protein YncE
MSVEAPFIKPSERFFIFSAMKILYAVLLLMIFVGNVFGQKEGNIWVGGSKGEIRFSDSAISSKRKDNQLFWRTSASICDSSGNLLFYTNGFKVFNRIGKIMQNGDSLAMGDYISYGYGLNDSPDGALIIPIPNSLHLFYLFYSDLNFIHTSLGNILYPTHLMCAKVDMDLDNGLGGIVSGEKDVVLLSDTLTQCVMQATKHANGRDWWLICHEYASNRYYKFLVTANGINSPSSQNIGIVYQLVNAQVSSPMKFSLDGSLFVHQSRDSNIVELMDFDRCSGEFNNYRSFKIDSVWAPARGVSISPSKQFIYVSSNFDEILQFDITKNNIFRSRKVVGKDDGKEDPFAANYYLQQLGPDGKIYISGYDADYALHIINSPDSAGKVCNFVEWGFPLVDSTTWFGCAPNEPNYDLAAVDGCDTVITSVQNENPRISYQVYPNPCDGKFQLNITGVTRKAEIVIHNETGEVIEQATLQPVNGFIHGFFNLQNEPAGVYLLKTHTDRGDISIKILKE